MSENITCPASVLALVPSFNGSHVFEAESDNSKYIPSQCLKKSLIFTKKNCQHLVIFDFKMCPKLEYLVRFWRENSNNWIYLSRHLF